MNKINNYYNKLKLETSAEEMSRRVISAANAEKPKRISFRKPVVAAAAAAVVLVGGVTAGAATGLINFNDIFGSITAETPELNESLAGIANNVKCDVSDDDYVVSLNGVSGSPASLLANLEISRADGTAISADGNGRIDVNITDAASEENYDSTGGSSCYYSLNSVGNIGIDWETHRSYDQLVAGNIIIGGKIRLSGSAVFTYGGEEKKLDWDMSFDYVPSEESTKVLKAADVSRNCSLTGSNADDKNATAEFDVSAITLTSTIGIVSCRSDDVLIPGVHENEIKLIKADGSAINAFVTGLSGELDSSSYLIIEYYDTENTHGELAIDLSQIKAISINGTVYELA